MVDPVGVSSREDLVERYRAYLEACNERAWDDVAEAVADPVLVNGRLRSRFEYVAGLQALVEVCPDYRWELREAVAERDRLAVHLRTRGTRTRSPHDAPGDDSPVSSEQFMIYQFNDDRIARVGGTANNARLKT